MGEPFRVGELTLRTDVRPADWAVTAARDFGENVVGCPVPPVFAAYARVFHPARRAARLVHLLSAYTATPERCWFAVWEGFGDLALPVEDGIARVGMPARPMLLLDGPLRAATTSLAATPWCDRRASLWWPDDRAWCVATDVDLMTTYVGGGKACVAALVADEELEAMEIGSDQRLAWDSDPVNPVPPAGDRH